ncbi:MAG: acetoin utilization protein AcuC [Candidatus Lokiarchaeota archaeon]|nr:acetoin utilization protein AcuC [Candidatus Lokiarchaeota archaeon]
MRDKVALIYTDKYQDYNFGPDHPLRPLRLELTYDLMKKLNLLNHKRIELKEPSSATREQIERVHDPEYVNIVKKLSDNPNDSSIHPYEYGLGPGDNPIFKGMYEASALVCGASILAADLVWNNEDTMVGFNPAGGLHHAGKRRASGFCIFNDIAVAMHHLKQLKKDIRIAYVDIDCHHGDGVQWLFYDDPNVLTISFHESGNFLFPGTGHSNEIGEGAGKGYSINFPLLPNTSDRMLVKLFRYCVPRLLDAYDPDILFTQLGVDMHYNDPLTQMGVSISAYRDIAQTIYTSTHDYCKNKWVAVGGGGYLMTVVPRAWSIFLARMLDVDLKNELPPEWIEKVKKDVPGEEVPYLLWDRDDRTEVQLLSHPELTKKMIDYNNSLKSLCDNEFVPNISR